MITQSMVSIVDHAAATETRDASSAKIVSTIRNGGRSKQSIEKIRIVFAETLNETGDRKAAKEAVRADKKKLPGILWSGRFSHRANDALIQHSGLLCADLDQLGDELKDTRTKLVKSNHLYALFLSPTGDGLKAVFRVAADPSKHLESFCAIERHVAELTGVHIDQSRKDLAGICFVSSDPDIYYNPDAHEIEPLPEPEISARPVSPNGAIDLSERQRVAEEIVGSIQWDSEARGFCTCPGKHLHTTGDGARDCKIHLDGAPTLYCFHDHCRGIRDAVNRELRSRIGKNERTTRIASLVRPTALLTPSPLYTPPPLDLLPLTLQNYVCASAESLNVDVSFVFLPLLSSLASAIGNARSILLKHGFIQSAIIWTVTIGLSGSRKSPSLDAGCFPMMERERELVRQNKQGVEIHAEQVAEWDAKVKKERGPKPEPPICLTCLMDDLTLAALADAIENNPRGVLVKKDELSHWFAAMDQFHDAKGADVSRWLSLHTGVFFGFDRRTDRRRFRLYQPRVCITGGIQPRVLARALTQDFFERGLPARFLFAAPPPRSDRWSEKVVADDIRRNVMELFESIFDLQPERDEKGDVRPKLLRLDREAKVEYVRYYNECGDAALDGDEREEAVWSKLSGYAARLALVGQLARDPNADVVTGDVMRAACVLARWFGIEAIRIYATLAQTDEQCKARRLVEFIQRRDGAVTVRDLTHYYRPLKNKAQEAQQQLTALVGGGFGQWEAAPSTPKGGQPTKRFRLFERAHEPSPSPLPAGSSRENEGSGDGDGIECTKNAEVADAAVLVI